MSPEDFVAVAVRLFALFQIVLSLVLLLGAPGIQCLFHRMRYPE